MQQRALRAAMIGGGVNSAVGRVHSIAMRMDGAFSLEAGCFSRNQDTNIESARQYGLAEERAFRSPEAMLEAMAAELDVIVLASPIQAHASHLNLALDHGLRVISDKPLLANESECAALLARVPADSTRVFSIFNYTGYPAVREMKRRIEVGEIGRVFKVMAEMPQDSYMRLLNQGKVGAIQSWRLIDGEAACLSLDLFVHLHSLVHFLCGNRPIEVSAWSRAISGVAPGLIDEVDAIVRHEEDLIVNAWYGKAALGFRNGLRVRIMGTNGSLQWHQENPEEIICADQFGNRMIGDRISSGSEVTAEPRYNRFKAGHPAGFIEAFANYYVDVARAIHEDRLNPYTLSAGVAAEGISLSQAIARASASGRTEVLSSTW